MKNKNYKDFDFSENPSFDIRRGDTMRKTTETIKRYGNLDRVVRGQAWTAQPDLSRIIRRGKCHTSRIGLLILIAYAIFALIWMRNYQNDTNTQIAPENVSQGAIYKELTGKISAYNLVSWQTDGSPCISAYNVDICQLVEQGVNVIANNCLPENTELEIEGLGRFVVLDKMADGTSCDHFDIAFASNKVIEAIQFGRQERSVKIYD